MPPSAGPFASTPRMLLVIAAFSQELARLPGLVRRRSTALRWLASAPVGGTQAVLVASGAGRLAAARAAREALGTFECRAIVSTGFAGALDPTLQVGDVLLADCVRHGPNSYPALLPESCPERVRRGSLVTVDEVVQTARAKRALASGGAAAVDMEAAAVAAVAAERGLAFYCVRAISDRADQDLPVDFNRALRGDGSFSPWSVTLQAGLDPGRWMRLAGLWRGSRAASQALADCLARYEFRA